MKTKIKYALENIVEEVVITLLATGCVVSTLIKEVNLKKEQMRKYEVAEFHQGKIPGISEGDAFILEEYVLPKNSLVNKLEPIYLTDIEIDNLLERHFKKINLPDYISKEYVKALIKQESGNNINAVSSWGARGLFQFLEGTWYDYEGTPFDEAFNPDKNIYAGLKHLKWISSYLEKNYQDYNNLTIEEKQDKISAVQNVGIGRLEENNWDISKMPTETRKHVRRIREKLDSTG